MKSFSSKNLLVGRVKVNQIFCSYFMGEMGGKSSKMRNGPVALCLKLISNMNFEIAC